MSYRTRRGHGPCRSSTHCNRPVGVASARPIYREPAVPVFLAPADCARAANPVRAERPAGLRAAADCIGDAAVGVVAVDRDDAPLLPPVFRPDLLPLFLPLMLATSMSASPALTRRASGMTPSRRPPGGRLIDPPAVPAAPRSSPAAAQTRGQRAVGRHTQRCPVLGVTGPTLTFGVFSRLNHPLLRPPEHSWTGTPSPAPTSGSTTPATTRPCTRCSSASSTDQRAERPTRPAVHVRAAGRARWRLPRPSRSDASVS